MAYRSPNFNILLEDGDFFVRRYDTFSTISTPQASWNGGESFGKLFQYISGENDRQQRISMTVPVINDLTDQSMTMEFYIPDHPSIPQPIHPFLNIKSYPQNTYAIIRFRGVVNDKTIAKQSDSLLKWVKARDYKVVGTFKVARYQGPFMPYFLRVNELWLPINSDTFGNDHT